MSKENWALETMYDSQEAIEKDINEIKEYLKRFESLKEDKKGNLLEIFEIYENAFRKVSHLYSYASMKKDEDSNVAESQKLEMTAQLLYVDLDSAFAFLKPFILDLDEAFIKALMEDEKY